MGGGIQRSSLILCNALRSIEVPGLMDSIHSKEMDFVMRRDLIWDPRPVVWTTEPNWWARSGRPLKEALHHCQCPGDLVYGCWGWSRKMLLDGGGLLWFVWKKYRLSLCLKKRENCCPKNIILFIWWLDSFKGNGFDRIK